MLEDAINGVLAGSSMVGNSQCQSAMQGLVYYAFEVLKNREIWNPSEIMKATIAVQKLNQQQSLFYA